MVEQVGVMDALINIEHWLPPYWVFGVATLVGFYLCCRSYHQLLPHPIPGIPHNIESANSIMGDLPDMMRVSQTRGMLEWLQDLCYKHSSPLLQIFIVPLGEPFLVLGDFREARDVLLRRVVEWDRADWVIDGIGGVGKHHHITQKTGPKWKAHRRMIKGLVSQPFLRSVVGPNMNKSIHNLIELWEFKAAAADGLPFDPSADISRAIFDGLMDITFGAAAVPSQTLSNLSDLRRKDLSAALESAGLKGPVEFPGPSEPLPVMMEAAIQSSDCMANSFSWPRPRWYWTCHWLWPTNWRAWWARTAFVRQQVTLHLEGLEWKQSKVSKDTELVQSALDLILLSEKATSAEEERSPLYFSEIIDDEIFGYLIAGHDSARATASWGVKFLSDNPDAQGKLREALRQGHPRAVAENRLPNFLEIMEASIPYFDASVEEILRLSGAFSFLFRQATRDTTLLGHYVPKGTHMLVLLNGPDTTQPGITGVDEISRSVSSQKQAVKNGIRAWDPTTVSEFQPERWLVESNEGALSFDSQAGPTLPFSGGLRGCFGRNHAYLQVKITFTMLVWRFEMLRCAPGLSSYEGLEKVTRGPKQCYVRFKTLPMH